MVQRQVLYLGEINDSQRAAWRKAIEVFDEGTGQSKQIALFPEDRLAPALDCDVVSVRLSAMRLRRPRQWGACWMATLLWDQLRLDEFWLAASLRANDDETNTCQEFTLGGIGQTSSGYAPNQRQLDSCSGRR